jgi:predicted Zn-ribbon and HTH transcriptional regulator
MGRTYYLSSGPERIALQPVGCQECGAPTTYDGRTKQALCPDCIAYYRRVRRAARRVK